MKTGRVLICVLQWSPIWGEYKGRVLSLSLVPSIGWIQLLLFLHCFANCLTLSNH
jgi:hypothetical protein